MDYEKIYAELLKEYPHNIAAFIKLGEVYEIKAEEIINSTIWTAEEKEMLLRSFKYDQEDLTIEYKDMDYEMWEYCIKEDKFTGLQALMSIMFNNSQKDEKSKEESCYKILSFIDTGINNDGKTVNDQKTVRELQQKQAMCLQILLQNIPEELLANLFIPRYKGKNIDDINDHNAIRTIIKAQDLDLLKQYLPRVDNISPYLSDAVETGNIELVEYLISQGADVNYVPEEPIVKYLLPLKVAIRNNDFEMVELLKSKGANVKLKVDNENFIEKLKSPKIEINKELTHHQRLIEAQGLDKENFEEKNKDRIKHLDYKRHSTPFEFACDIFDIYKRVGETTPTIVFGKGYIFEKDFGYISDEQGNFKELLSKRINIIDSIYSDLEEDDRRKIDHNNLLKLAILLQSKQHFNNYVEYIKKYKLESSIEPNELITAYLVFNRNTSILADEMIALINHCYPEYNAAKQMFEQFITTTDNLLDSFPHFYATKLSKHLLGKLSEEDKKDIIAVPDCQDLESLQVLLQNGFNINQQDKNGNTLLINKCRKKFSEPIFRYLLQNADLSHRNKDNKLALYYAILNNHILSDGEYSYEGDGFLPNIHEELLIELINSMKNEEVCDSSISDAIDARYDIRTEEMNKGYERYDLLSKGHFLAHKELFKTLKNKGFVFSDELVKTLISVNTSIISSLTAKKCLDFIYSIMDDNNDIQDINLSSEKDKIIKHLKGLSYTKAGAIHIIDRLQEFDEMTKECKKFKETIVPQKKFPESYLSYTKEYYGTEYDKIDDWYTEVLINALYACGSNEDMLKVLDSCADVDVNHKIFDKPINMGIWDFVAQTSDIVDVDDDGEPIYGDEHFSPKRLREGIQERIVFTGGIVQFAILTDNVELVKELKNRGAEISFETEDGDLTFDYVNSYTMLGLISELTGKKMHNELVGAEVEFFNSLISESTVTENKVYQKLKPNPNGETV